MKVILKSNVENLGGIGDTVKVASGYARNYLIPKGLAVEATKGNIRQFESEKETWMKKAARLKEDAGKLAEELSALTLSFSRRAGEDGKLFGSVTSMDIAAALKEKGYEVDRKDLLLDEPIKTLGEFTVGVKLHPEVRAELKILVEKE